MFRKIAVVHDWLPVYAGAERVLEQILNIFRTRMCLALLIYCLRAKEFF